MKGIHLGGARVHLGQKSSVQSVEKRSGLEAVRQSTEKPGWSIRKRLQNQSLIKTLLEKGRLSERIRLS